jgi:MoxR-like ATPase
VEPKSPLIDEAKEILMRVRSEVAKAIVGQKKLVDSLLMGLLSDGHLLLEGVPGIAKTLAVNTLAKVLKLEFKRIQFTPDLLPSDLIGTSVFNPKEGTFFVQKGPIFTNIVLADEINRAPPKVQSALLEVMQEKQVTISGTTYQTGAPFLVLATQNPIEHEGTYPLPEAETDRFMMKVKIDYPTPEEEKEIVIRKTEKGKEQTPLPILSGDDIVKLHNVVDSVYIDDKVLGYIVDIVFATRKPKSAQIDPGLLEYGASPRASIYLAKAGKVHALFEGRGYVTPYDIKEVAKDVLRHRLILSYEAEAQEVGPDTIIERILAKVSVP